MDFPVLVSQDDGHFTAEVFGSSELKAEGSTRDLALAELRKVIRLRIGHGELISMPVELKGLHPIVGRYKDDPTMADLREEIYAERDRERDEICKQLDSTADDHVIAPNGKGAIR